MGGGEVQEREACNPLAGQGVMRHRTQPTTATQPSTTRPFLCQLGLNGLHTFSQ